MIKTRKTVIATVCSVAVMTAVAGTPALASSAEPRTGESMPEERRGALIGGILGAGVGGPIGATVGVILGGGMIGTVLGLDRINGELKTELAKTKVDKKQEQYRLEKRIAILTDALEDARVEAATSPRLPIQFRTASSALESHYENELTDVAKAIADRPDARVTLSGFADRRGDESYNLTLSKERVDAVKQFLMKHGVARSQIVTEAFGETKPVAREATPENHFFDRRVVLQVSVDDLPIASR